MNVEKEILRCTKYVKNENKTTNIIPCSLNDVQNRKHNLFKNDKQLNIQQYVLNEQSQLILKIIIIVVIIFIGIINFTLKCSIALSFLKHPDLCIFAVGPNADINRMQVGSRKQKAVVCKEVTL